MKPRLQLELSKQFPLFKIPDFQTFGNLLYDRFYLALEYHNLITHYDQPYTIILNLVDRDNINKGTKQIEKRNLIYAGTERQRFWLRLSLENEKKRREILQKDLKAQKKWLEDNHKTELDSAWKHLANAEIDSTKAITGSGFYKKIDDGKLDLREIKIKSLDREYFKTHVKGFRDNLTKNQEKEYEIFNECNVVKGYSYVTIPIIQWTYFDGFAYLVFKKDETLTPEEQEKDLVQIIKIYLQEYEGLLLDWQTYGENMNLLSNLNIKDAEKKIRLNKNPILKKVGLDKFYLKYTHYSETRTKLNDEIPQAFKKQHRKTAIISILVDSYAHNISAHSLTALHWWFRKRAAKLAALEEEEDVNKNIENVKKLLEVSIKHGLTENIKTEIIGCLDELQFSNSNDTLDGYEDEQGKLSKAFLSRKTPLTQEVYPLLKFLLEKGAFWSGVTRDYNFGGKISSLYSILWYDFIKNPLYLGTIAYSEGIVKLNLNIIIYKSEDKCPKDFECTYQLDKVYQFIEINLDATDKEKSQGEWESDFIKLGDDYEFLKEELFKYKLYFPGGVVGKHAFFTIIENEIRNVKHYYGTRLAEMQKEGVTLNISLQEVNVNKEQLDKEKELVKIGIWIDQPSIIANGSDSDKYEDKYLLLKKTEGLILDIMTENYAPRLGGNYQDKICAGMLFNNEFGRVEDRDEKKQKDYYAWIWPATSIKGEPYTDFEVNPSNYDVGKLIRDYERKYGKDAYVEIRQQDRLRRELYKLFRKEFVKEYKEFIKKGERGRKTEGYLKKYFHIWRGANIHYIKDSEVEKLDLDWENISRFRFVAIPENSDAQMMQKVRKQGVIRVIKAENIEVDGENEEGKSTKEIKRAYKKWLPKWVKENCPKTITIRTGLEQESGEAFSVGQLVYNEGTIDYSGERVIKHKADLSLTFVHGGKERINNDDIRYSTRNILGKHFFERKGGYVKFSQSPKNLEELYEVLVTKIFIFDNRVEHRIPDDKKQAFRDKLRCGFFSERLVPKKGDNSTHWEREKKDVIKKCHFLVMHLSFIESIMKKKQAKVDEDMIGYFIKEELLQGVKLEDIGDNFMFVVTTGRGRGQWWKSLEDKYKRFTTFTPVESLISSVENAISMKDDIELKYRLVKALFGS